MASPFKFGRYGQSGAELSELLPGFAADVFRSGAGGLSILASAIGGGAILGGLWLGHRAYSAGLTYVAMGGALAGALAAIMAIATTNRPVLIAPPVVNEPSIPVNTPSHGVAAMIVPGAIVVSPARANKARQLRFILLL